MAFQSVPDTAKIEVIFERSGVRMQNVLYARRAGGYNSSQINDLAVAVDQWMADEYLPGMVSDVTYVETIVTGQEFENDIQVSVNTNSGVGTNAGVGLPNNVTKAVTLESGLTGRSARGRLFYVGLPNGALTADENHVTAGVVTYLIDLIEALITVLTGIQWILVIVSRNTGGAPRPTGVTFTVTGASVSDTTTDSQRARLPLN